MSAPNTIRGPTVAYLRRYPRTPAVLVFLRQAYKVTQDCNWVRANALLARRYHLLTSTLPSMQREDSPPLTPLERTARWVEAQAAQSHHDSPPPSPADRSSTQASSSNRTTTSSEQSIPRHPMAISPTTLLPSTSVRRQRADSRARGALQPFPQSPPGSGYPVPLEVAPPRAEADISKANTLAFTF
ncbi:hypothetical protein A0H81_01556 [Grifola frondosa]|uniref:Uncharacterized protein n=1 Tax=Grifola frondosa TaxID=5627 RepID=A0A1C7MSU0_GRIFR|nr:hypothetical protein A0H81_01556 [Grifola frondosa]